LFFFFACPNNPQRERQESEIERLRREIEERVLEGETERC
jgi:hypothetical protein